MLNFFLNKLVDVDIKTLQVFEFSDWLSITFIYSKISNVKLLFFLNFQGLILEMVKLVKISLKLF